MIAKWVIVAAFTLGGLRTVARIGKPARSLTGGEAAVAVAITAAYIVLIVLFWRTGDCR